ncbi:MAG: DUF3662 domain-containing protein [Actinobacteria bacterium]|jgi:hypothetical protein|nr:DUF3662 domain-containing protein [Actinomycetota bacterium]MCL6104299.1 DUF3662 domain-containing protein [Actinomycetota bacterium]
MGLSGIERRLEHLVEGVFAKVFHGGLQPVEIARRLSREMDLQRQIGPKGFIVPNDFEVRLSPSDYQRLGSFTESLEAELEEALVDYARGEGYVLLGSIGVKVAEDADLNAGIFAVASRITQGSAQKTKGVWIVLPDGKRVVVGDETILIGRSSNCTIPLKDPNVSRRHAQVSREGGDVVITDLGSTNSTLVNGMKIKRRKLVDDDEIMIGITKLRFRSR